MTDEKEEIKTDSFRQAMRRFAATVSIISTVSSDGTPHGMAATAVTSLSFDPLSLLVAVNKSASMFEPLKSSGLFCVNVLHSSQRNQCDIFSRKEIRDQRFKVGNWEINEDGIPYLTDAQASIFCEVDQNINAGSHSAFIGLVFNVITDELIDPLIYLNGGFLNNTEATNTSKHILNKDTKKHKSTTQNLEGIDWLW